jgi:branched-chain amino acid aminotransferase
MPIPIGVLTPNGVQAAPYVAESMADAANKEPQGVYTVGRTLKRDHVLLLDEHFNRLERSAQLEGINAHLDRVKLRQAIRELIDQSGFAESRFRITIPRDTPDQPIITLEAFKPLPEEIYENGVRVMTVGVARRNPVAKTTEWVTTRRAVIEAFPVGIYEGILTSPDGALLEGTTSNFFAVKDAVLRTADDSSVLSGIARRILLNVAKAVLPIETKPIHLEEISTLSEALLTSASRGVVPIVEIDGQKIGDGSPGQYSKMLRQLYNDWSNVYMEPI